MRDPAPAMREIIRLVESSHLPVRATLDRLGITRSTFYRWHDAYQRGGPEALSDHPSRPSRVWNRPPAEIREQIVALALEERMRRTDFDLASFPFLMKRRQAHSGAPERRWPPRHEDIRER